MMATNILTPEFLTFHIPAVAPRVGGSGWQAVS
jgi:hypothetical protein